MSFGSPYSKTMEKLVKECTDNGIHIVVSACNKLSDACIVSLAAAPSAITVATSYKSDQIADFSNYGSCVDIYAPESDNDSHVLKETSMSAPHVVGTVALYISTYGSLHPSNMSEAIISLATKNNITGIPDRNNTYFLRVSY
ncbi:23080_t:CDS:2 [Dentiscutata erythropus]|uniref:23080_t:CDS:1 n=1 Tax=Dentiscutata erythropus TaxID=1348616 RepID=A0A9N8Z8M5_9GLOM|nr:23080_t:CDS:2 [Dentiscutata erythropus]